MECKRPRRLQSRGRLRILVQEQEQGRGQGLLLGGRLGGRCFQLLALVDTVHPFIAPN